ncbi:ParB/RepB/Spo0J family partition protein [Acidihalobacter aeolianus]|nr:ParB N-terminal domain-containing protein [Acidihalobacter aeolianus]
MTDEPSNTPKRGSTRSSIRQAIRGDTKLMGSLGNQIQSISAKNDGKIVRLPADKIKRNPENPRKLPFTEAEIVGWRQAAAGLDDSTDIFSAVVNHVAELYEDDKLKQSKAIALVELAGSISEELLQPPVVYISSERGQQTEYTIHVGERRYLAMLMLGASDIPCILRSAPKDRYRINALAENIQRDELSFPEKIAAMDGICRIWSDAHDGQEMTAEEFSRTFKIVPRQARRYLLILRDRKVYKEIIEGKIVSQAAALERAGGDNQTETTDSPANNKSHPITNNLGRGRRRTKVTLGAVSKPEHARFIIQRLLGNDPDFVVDPDLDWSDIDAVQSTWDRVLKHLLAHARKQ